LQGVSKVDVIAGDSPANWFLHTLPLKMLRDLANRYGAKFVVDASVQPLQKDLSVMADLVVVSLSKWPSAGHTLGGAILGSNDLVAQVERVAAIDGHAMPAEAALTILQHLPTLEDRMRSASIKARYVRDALLQHPQVSGVRLPDDPALQGLCGGQLVIELKDPEVGIALEQLIGFNAFNHALTLPQLACTFGGVISTLEHFTSNVRHRDGMAKDRSTTGESLIPDTFVRLSIGSESAEELAAGLTLLLNLTCERHAYS
jgi:cystathionine beta-lyase/cystathionine gamma-synthase